MSQPDEVTLYRHNLTFAWDDSPNNDWSKRTEYRAIPAAAYAALLTRVEAAEGALKNLVCAVSTLMAESRGVDGLHQNGDIATWEEIGPDGRYSEWLGDSFHEARLALRASGTREGA